MNYRKSCQNSKNSSYRMSCCHLLQWKLQIPTRGLIYAENSRLENALMAYQAKLNMRDAYVIDFTPNGVIDLPETVEMVSTAVGRVINVPSTIQNTVPTPSLVKLVTLKNALSSISLAQKGRDVLKNLHTGVRKTIVNAVGQRIPTVLGRKTFLAQFARSPSLKLHRISGKIF